MLSPGKLLLAIVQDFGYLFIILSQILTMFLPLR